MTTEILESLIQDPDVFALGIDSQPVRDVLIEFANRIDNIQNKISKASLEGDSKVDKNDMTIFGNKINDMMNQMQKMSEDFSGDIREVKSHFSFQLNDLKEKVDRNIKDINYGRPMSAPSMPPTNHNSPRAPMEIVPAKDDETIKRIEEDINHLSMRFDSVMDLIANIQNDRSPNENSFFSPIPEPQILPINENTHHSEINDLGNIKSTSDIKLTPSPETQSTILINSDNNKANDSKISDLFNRFDLLVQEQKSERERGSNITKTINKMIIELDSQRKDVNIVNKENQSHKDEIMKMNDRITDQSAIMNRKFNEMSTQFERMNAEINAKLGKIELLNNQTKGNTSSNENIDFMKTFDSLKNSLIDQITDLDANYRKQIHYLKQEITTLKQSIGNPVAINHSPEITPAPEKVEIQIEKPNSSQLKSRQPSNSKIVTKPLPPLNPVNNESRPELLLDDKEFSSQMTSMIRLQAKVFANAEAQTDIKELDPIPIVRMSFATPLTSIPNTIAMHSIVSRPPEDTLPFRNQSKTNPVTRHSERTQSIPQNAIGTNTSAREEEDEEISTVDSFGKYEGHHVSSVFMGVEIKEHKDHEAQTDSSKRRSMATTPVEKQASKPVSKPDDSTNPAVAPVNVDIQYLEKYDTHGEVFIKPSKGLDIFNHESNSGRMIRTKQMEFVFERMMNLTIMTEVKAPESPPIIIEVPKNNGSSSDVDMKSIIEQISSIKDESRLKTLENRIVSQQQQLNQLYTRMDEIPPDIFSQVNEISKNNRVLSKTIETFEDKLSNDISKIKSLIKESSSRPIPANPPQFTIDTLPQINILQQIISSNSSGFSGSKNDSDNSSPHPPIDAKVIVDSILQQVNLALSKYHNEVSKLQSSIDHVDERCDLLKYTYSTLEKHSYDLEESLNLIKNSLPNMSRKIEYSRKNTEDHLNESNNSENGNYIRMSSSSETVYTEVPPKVINYHNINTEPTNILLATYQNGTSLTIDPILKEPSPPFDPSEIIIPRYDDQFRIVREALVDMRTGMQLLKQNIEDKLNKIHNGIGIDDVLSIIEEQKSKIDESAVITLRQKLDYRMNDFDQQIHDLREELYSFMKNQPERIVERIKEVHISNGNNPEKRKKPTTPPQPLPAVEIDVDLQIKKTKKLIGDVESPRFLSIKPIAKPTTPPSEPESPIIVDHHHELNTRLPQNPHVNTTHSTNTEKGYDTKTKLPGDTGEVSHGTDFKDMVTKPQIGHVVPQVIDDVYVYNALPPSDFTDALVPILMQLRTELQFKIDGSNERIRIVENLIDNKVDKEYVEKFFRKMRISMQETNEKVSRVQMTVPERVTKEELDERIENVIHQFTKEESTPAGRTTYKCLFCGSVKSQISGQTADDPNLFENTGNKPGPAKGSLIVGTDRGVYKGRGNYGKFQTSRSEEPHTNPKI